MATDYSCCIFIPLYKTEWSSAETKSVERCISLLHNFHFFFGYKSNQAPELCSSNFSTHLPSLQSWNYLPIDPIWLSSAKAYSQLMLNPCFYRLFLPWNYLLVFQPDAWILNGNLSYWISKHFTYIGAPWCPTLGPNKDCPITGVGNGGLSLRNIPETINVLTSSEYSRKPILSACELADYLNLFKRYTMHSIYIKPIVFMARLFLYVITLLLYPLGFRNNLAFLANAGMNEDIILGHYSQRVCKWIRIPDVSMAAHFSLESNASQIAEAFSVDVPFGCHAWEKRDKSFFIGRYKSFFSSLHDENSYSLS